MAAVWRASWSLPSRTFRRAEQFLPPRRNPSGWMSHGRSSWRRATPRRAIRRPPALVRRPAASCGREADPQAGEEDRPPVGPLGTSCRPSRDSYGVAEGNIRPFGRSCRRSRVRTSDADGCGGPRGHPGQVRVHLNPARHQPACRVPSLVGGTKQATHFLSHASPPFQTTDRPGMQPNHRTVADYLNASLQRGSSGVATIQDMSPESVTPTAESQPRARLPLGCQAPQSGRIDTGRRGRLRILGIFLVARFPPFTFSPQD